MDKHKYYKVTSRYSVPKYLTYVKSESGTLKAFDGKKYLTSGIKYTEINLKDIPIGSVIYTTYNDGVTFNSLPSIKG